MMAREVRQSGAAAAATARATRTLDGAARQAAAGIARVGSQGQQAESGLRQMALSSQKVKRELHQVQKTASQTATAFGGLKKVAGTALLAGAGTGLIRSVNTYQQLQNRLRAVAHTESQRRELQKELLALSQRTYSSLGANVQAYQRLSGTFQRLGRTQEQTLAIQETLSQSIALGGSSADEAARGMIQFVQALDGGVLRAEEYNSLVEQTPGLLDAVVAGLNQTGAVGRVTRGDLRRLVEDGALTAEILVDALAAAQDEIADQYTKLTPTLDQAMQKIRNAATDSSGALAGLGDAAAAALSAMADRFMAVEAAAIAVAAVIGGRLVAAGYGLVKQRYIAAAAAVREAAAERAVAAARTATTAATIRATAATRTWTAASIAARTARGFLGGWVGAATTVLTAGYLAWQAWGSEAEEQIDKTLTAAERAKNLNERLEQLSPAQTAAEEAQAELEDLQREKQALIAQIRQARQQRRLSPAYKRPTLLEPGETEVLDAQAHIRELQGQLGTLSKNIKEAEDKYKRLMAPGNEAKARAASAAELQLIRQIAQAKRQEELAGLEGAERIERVYRGRLAAIQEEHEARVAGVATQEREQQVTGGLVQKSNELRLAQEGAAKAIRDAAIARLDADAAMRKEAEDSARESRIQGYQEDTAAARLRGSLIGSDETEAQKKLAAYRVELEYKRAIQGLDRAAADDQEEINAALERRNALLDELEARYRDEQDTSSTPAWLKSGREARARARGDPLTYENHRGRRRPGVRCARAQHSDRNDGWGAVGSRVLWVCAARHRADCSAASYLEVIEFLFSFVCGVHACSSRPFGRGRRQSVLYEEDG